MPSTNVRYVDPNAASGGTGITNSLTGTDRAYSSLNAWEAARQADLPAGDIIEKVICSSDDAGSTHLADTTPVTIDGWTTDATRYIQIEAASSHGGKWNPNIYRLEVVQSANDQNFRIQENYVRILGLQVKITLGASITTWQGMATSVSGVSNIFIDKCILVGDRSGYGITNSFGIQIDDNNASSITTMRNCLMYGFEGGSSSDVGIAAWTVTGTVNIQNCVVIGSSVGFHQQSGGTVLWKNCGAAGCNTGFSYGTQTTCSSTTPTFVNEGADDFHLAAGDTTWRGQGTDLSGTFTDDIDGQTRSAPWDIGADEYVAAGGGGLDAYLKAIFTKTPSVDGLLNKTDLTRTASADALLLKLGLTRDASLDAILYAAATYTETAALDSYLQAGYTRAAGIDALIQMLAQETLGADALLQLLATKTASVDALLLAAILKNVGVDGVLNKVGLDRTASADALLNKIGLTGVASLDAILVATLTHYLTPSIDGYLQKMETRTASADALLNKAAQEKSLGADGYLQAGMTKAGSLDACILGTLLKTISIDAALNKVGLTGTSSVDAFLQELGTSSASLDACLLSFAAKTLGLDAFLMGEGGAEVFASLDALLNRVGLTGSSSIDAFLQKLSLTRTASVDAFLQAAYTRTLGIDGVMSKAYYETPSLDALAQKTQEEPSALDALLSRTGATLGASADALLQKTFDGSAAVDGYLYRQVIKTAVADALLQAGYSRAASLDAILLGLGQTEIVALLDALLHAAGLERPASFDAFLYRGLSKGSRLDACLDVAHAEHGGTRGSGAQETNADRKSSSKSSGWRKTSTTTNRYRGH